MPDKAAKNDQADRLPILVLASGKGSNFHALQQRASADDAQFRVGGLICNRPEAAVVTLARQHSIPVDLVDDRAFEDRKAFDAALGERLLEYPGHLFVMAGFMRVLGDHLVNRFLGRMINLHPSLLPEYTGLDTHRRVLESGDTEHGASVHFVVPELDAGPVISQVRIPVPQSITADQLAARLAPLERRLLVNTVEFLATERVQWHHGHIYLDDKKLEQPLQFD